MIFIGLLDLGKLEIHITASSETVSEFRSRWANEMIPAPAFTAEIQQELLERMSKNNRGDIFQRNPSTLGANSNNMLILNKDHLIKILHMLLRRKNINQNHLAKNLTELRSRPDAVARIDGSRKSFLQKRIEAEMEVL